ncbi:hypothetical protein LXL04_027689 [Taraxacum kok-saghyz]
MTPHSNLTPREYQLDVFQVAMRRNIIAHLDTDAGKTMIAILIIKQVALSLATQPSKKKQIIFLAPTRNLQFKVLKENTNLTVDFYHGTKVGTMNGKKEFTALLMTSSCGVCSSCGFMCSYLVGRKIHVPELWKRISGNLLTNHIL